MCWSRDVSILAFTLIIGSCLLLKKFGNPEYRQYNNILCYFFIFVGLMQLVDFFMWIDLKCNKGYNKVATVLGMILNYLQPFILFMLVLIFTKINNKLIIIAKYLNYGYLVIIIGLFIHYIITTIYSKTGFCSVVNKEGHLKWLWTKKNKYWNFYSLYHIAMIFNIYLLWSLGYSVISPIICYILLFISMIYFKQNVGELWCFFVVIIPLFEFMRQQILKSN